MIKTSGTAKRGPLASFSFWILLLLFVAALLTGYSVPAPQRLQVLLRGGNGDAHTTTDESSSPSNMNGKYRLAATPGAHDTERLFPTNYREYPKKQTRHFDLYSPYVEQLYSQVFWKSLEPVPLPADILDKFANSTMAVVGFELDQVMELSNTDGTTTEISIPMNALYNHHFESTMIGGDARFELVMPGDQGYGDDDEHAAMMGHGRSPHQPYYKVVDPTSTPIPNRVEFGGANGGEVRKSFHGYAPGFVQLIQQPKSFQVTPMQIDTWHREAMSLSSQSNFVPGPLPRSSLAPLTNPLYSGLLECPVTTRIIKHLPVTYQLWNSGNSPCPEGLHPVESAEACFQAVASLLPDDTTSMNQWSGSTPNRPTGCSVSIQQEEDALDYTIEAYYNALDANSTVPCGTSGTSGDKPRYFASESNSDTLTSFRLEVDTQANQVDLFLTGPANVWYGIGFGAQAMKDHPWTIIVEPTDDDTIRVSERILGDHVPGSTVDPPTLTLVNVDWDDNRNLLTVQVRRPATGHAYFDFDTLTTAIPFIRAVGSSSEFGYHQAKEASEAVLLPITHHAGGTCLCESDPPPFGHTQGGTLEYRPVPNQPGEHGRNDKVSWNNKCTDVPRTNLLEQQNPTCDLRTYEGGQVACHHMWSLLDADQEIPWPDQPLRYRLKFRFWYQEYDDTYHQQVHRATWGIASPVEYDVPKCGPDVPGCSIDETTGKLIHTIQGSFIVNSGPLVAAHFHCHAPTCLSTSLYLCDEGVKPQDCNATTGTLICRQDAAYDGQGQEDEDGRFQEPGFIAQPPCLWGSPEYGLEEPVLVQGRSLFAVKTADATYGHHGEMAWLQVYYID